MRGSHQGHIHECGGGGNIGTGRDKAAAGQHQTVTAMRMEMVAMDVKVKWYGDGSNCDGYVGCSRTVLFGVVDGKDVSL